MRMIRVLAAATLAAAFAFLADPAPEAWAGATVSLGKPKFDPAPQSVPVAGQPISFSATGRMSGGEKDEEPWVGIFWEFGDKQYGGSGPMFGAGPKTHTTTHTYVAAGEYVVKCTAFHGYKGSGFKYQRTAKFKVLVQCAGTDTGPVKCPTPSYLAWSGEWELSSLDMGGDLSERTPPFRREWVSLSFTQVGKRVTGHMEIDDTPAPRKYDFSGDWVHTVGKTTTGMVVKGTYTGDGVDPKKGRHRFVVVLYDAPEVDGAYRVGGAQFENLVEGDPDFGPTVNMGFRPKSKPADADTANLCTIIGAGQKSSKVGRTVTFAIQVVNVGPACLSKGRLALDIHIDGATTRDGLVHGTGFAATSVTDHDVVIVPNGLGDGWGKKAQRIVVLVAAEVDPIAGGGEVRCTARLTDIGAATDPLVKVTLPPGRLVCIPISE